MRVVTAVAIGFWVGLFSAGVARAEGELSFVQWKGKQTSFNVFLNDQSAAEFERTVRLPDDVENHDIVGREGRLFFTEDGKFSIALNAIRTRNGRKTVLVSYHTPALGNSTIANVARNQNDQLVVWGYFSADAENFYEALPAASEAAITHQNQDIVADKVTMRSFNSPAVKLVAYKSAVRGTPLYPARPEMGEYLGVFILEVAGIAFNAPNQAFVLQKQNLGPPPAFRRYYSMDEIMRSFSSSLATTSNPAYYQSKARMAQVLQGIGPGPINSIIDSFRDPNPNAPPVKQLDVYKRLQVELNSAMDLLGR